VLIVLSVISSHAPARVRYAVCLGEDASLRVAAKVELMVRQNIPVGVRRVGLVPLGVAALVLSGVWFGFGGMPLDEIPLFGKLFATLVASVFLFVGSVS
jgi:hypothetical protein